MATGWKTLKLSQLVKADWNYKRDDAAKMAKLVANLKRNGLVQNLIVRPLPTGFYEVVNGNHRTDALLEIGAEDAMCFDVGEVSQAHAIRIATETNGINFEDDNLKLADRLFEITEAFGVAEVAATGAHSEAEIANYLRMRTFDYSQYSGGTPGAATADAAPEQSSSDDGTEWVGLEFRVPIEVGEAFEEQLVRVKAVLYPGKDPKKVSDVTCLEALAEMLRQMDAPTLKAQLTG